MNQCQVRFSNLSLLPHSIRSCTPKLKIPGLRKSHISVVLFCSGVIYLPLCIPASPLLYLPLFTFSPLHSSLPCISIPLLSFSSPSFPHLSAFLISFEQIVNSFEIFQIHFIQFLSPSCVLMVINMHPCTAFFFKYNLCSSNYTYFMDLSRDFMFVV